MPASPPSRVVVIGAGGHAKVVIELLRADGYEVAALVDADAAPRRVLGAPVVGDDSALAGLRAEGLTHAFVAIGDNRTRLRLAGVARAAGFALVNAISPAATVSPSASLGVGVAVMAGAVINAEAVIGDLAIVNTGATIDHDVRLGEAAHIGPGASLAGGVQVGAGAMLGVGASAIPGVRIGDQTVIGAGACVVRDLPGDVIATGVPATIARMRAS